MWRICLNLTEKIRRILPPGAGAGFRRKILFPIERMADHGGGVAGRKRPREEDVEPAAMRRDEVCYVLGDASAEKCSYSRGFVRQPIFACLTCHPSGDCGFCLACSLTCHEGHVVEEIFTKRGFRCACKGARMASSSSTGGADGKMSGCQLMASKDDGSARPYPYNNNFKGIYCTCQKPYPDPSMTEEEQEMHQCVVCEDWYHNKCIEPKPERFKNFDEMVCAGCSSKYPFLSLYARLPDDVIAHVESESEAQQQQQQEQHTSTRTCFSKNDKQEEKGNDDNRDAERKCNPEDYLFFNLSWRAEICQCERCSKKLSDLNISFLNDPEDSVAAFERRGKQKIQNDTIQQLLQPSALGDNKHASQGSAAARPMIQALQTALRDCLAPGTNTRPLIDSMDAVAMREFTARYVQLQAGLAELVNGAAGGQLTRENLAEFLGSLGQNGS